MQTAFLSGTRVQAPCLRVHTPTQTRARTSVQVQAAKKDIHPKVYEDAKVICNGEEVMTVAGTIPEYNVDIWSGNHPFYQGQTGTIVMDEGRVNRFKRRFDGLDSLSAVSTVSGGGKAPTKKEMRDAVAKLTGKAPPSKKGKK